MKRLFFIPIILILFSCTDKKSIITKGEWLETLIIIDDVKSDTLYNDIRVKFLDTGIIMKNKYFTEKSTYKIKSNNIHFLNNDTISVSYKILKITPEEIISENKYFDEDNKEITVKLFLKETEPFPDKAYDKILFNLAEICDFGEIDDIRSGIFLSFSPSKYDDLTGFTYINPYDIEPKIKGAVDRAIGTLPKREKLMSFSQWQRCLYNYYEWETLDLIVKMENYFDNNYKDESYLRVKVWITEK
jgi:hypothetical protein